MRLSRPLNITNITTILLEKMLKWGHKYCLALEVYQRLVAASNFFRYIGVQV